MNAEQEKELVETITKKVTAEVMQVIRPLLEKMEEVMQTPAPAEPPTPNEPAGFPPPPVPQTREQQLLSIQEAAKEKEDMMRQKIEAKINRLRNRTNRFIG